MIYIEEQKAKQFNLNLLTNKKKSEIEELAERIRSAKNAMSLFVYLHWEFFVDSNMSKYTFYEYIINNLKIDLPSQVKTEAIEDVYEKYNQRRQTTRKFLLDFTLTHVSSVIYYQKAVHYGNFILKKGAVKDVKYSHKKTDMTIFVATMSLFTESTEEEMHKAFLEYIERNIDEITNELNELRNKGITNKEDENKEKKLLKSIDHFNKQKEYINDEIKFHRCFKLSRDRRDRIVHHYKQPITFTTLNFRARSKVQTFIDKNRNSNKNFEKSGHHSLINAYIDLGGVIKGRTHMYLPVKFAKKYHGNLADYKKISESNSYNYQYCILFDAKGNVRRLQATKKVLTEYPEITDEMSVIGGDENIKHNMEQFSDGSFIDWPRQEIDKLVKVELKLDDVRDKIKSDEMRIGFIKRANESKDKKDAVSFDKIVSEIKRLKNTEKQLVVSEKELQTTIDGIIEQTISLKLKEFVEKYGTGKIQIALEYIDGQFAKCRIMYKTESGEEYSQNKLFRLCHFGNIKDTIKRIGRRYGIPVSFVPSYYTSQMCPHCGHIDRSNRKTQELVKCVACGEEFPADLKSSRLIALILKVTVLREALLVQDETGAYKPRKNLKKETVLKTLQKYSGELVT